MKRTHLSLYYLLTYLFAAGLSFLVIPHVILKLLLSTGDYGDVMPRLLGVIILGLGILVFQIVRLKLEVLYGTTLIVRGVILTCLFGLYLYVQDPFFLVVIGIVSVGVALTGVSYWLDVQGI